MQGTRSLGKKLNKSSFLIHRGIFNFGKVKIYSHFCLLEEEKNFRRAEKILFVIRLFFKSVYSYSSRISARRDKIVVLNKKQTPHFSEPWLQGRLN